jgi:hypothetical protein
MAAAKEVPATSISHTCVIGGSVLALVLLDDVDVDSVVSVSARGAS